eukprot:166499-Chlamydomonas_euryale.AAC.1
MWCGGEGAGTVKHSCPSLEAPPRDLAAALRVWVASREKLCATLAGWLAGWLAAWLPGWLAA